jgi:RasGEF family protein
MIQKFSIFFGQAASILFSCIALGIVVEDYHNNTKTPFEIRETILSMIKDADQRNIIAFTSPMFLSDHELYEIYLIALNDKIVPADFIIEALKEIFEHDFPHGRPSAEGIIVLRKISLILPKNSIDFGKIPLSDKQDFVVKTIVRNKNINSDWSTWKSRDIAVALTMRDVFLLSLATYPEMEKYRKDQYENSSVKDIFDQADSTVNWIRFQLIKADKKKREKLVKKWLKVAEEFFKLNNLHGLLQVTNGLGGPVANLIDWKSLGKLKEKQLTEYDLLLLPKYYYKMLQGIDENIMRLPLLGLLFKNLVINTENLDTINKITILKFASEFRKINLCKQQSHYDLVPEDHILKFFQSLPASKDLEFINDYLLNPQETIESEVSISQLPLNGAEYFARDLAQFGAPYAIEPLFKAGIFSVKQLLDLVENTTVPEKQDILKKIGLSDKDCSLVGFYSFVNIK